MLAFSPCKFTIKSIFKIVLVFSMSKKICPNLFLSSNFIIKIPLIIIEEQNKCLKNFSHFDKFFNNDRDIHRKKNRKFEKALSFTHCSFSVFKKLSLYNLLFLGFLIRKMAASDHFEVLVYGLNLKKNLDSHFRNLKTLKRTNYTWIILPHT